MLRALLALNFPYDADGQVLRKLFKRGVNFSIPHDVDFMIAVPNEISGNKVAEIMHRQGYATDVEQDEESESWTCYCHINMLLDYKRIIEAQKQMDEVSKPFGGYSDGWGTFGE